MSLIHLINASLISANDEIFFYFKDKIYTGFVDGLGMIYKTTCNDSDVFVNNMPFETVNEWCDICIQQISKEYITRFSAWKRCTHRNSGLILNNLRQLCSVFSVPRIPVTNTTISTLQKTISLLLKYTRKLEKQNMSYKKYIYSETDYFDETDITKPTSILTIAKMYNTYLSGKSIIESNIESKKEKSNGLLHRTLYESKRT